MQTAEEARHLVISGVMVDDAGRYTCTASARDTVSASALLQVIGERYSQATVTYPCMVRLSMECASLAVMRKLEVCVMRREL